MISHDAFAALRLGPFRSDAEVEELEDWEYEGRIWVGESIGFSEWLCLEQTPDRLGSITLDFNEFPEEAAPRVLEALELPLRPGMTFEEIKEILGEPARTLRFGSSRLTYEFNTPAPEPYQISCTVHNENGLIYLGVMIP